jgi:CRP-like cAMP-binding protein
MLEKIMDNVLFQGLTMEDLTLCLKCSNAKVKEYKKNEIIFSQLDPPRALFVLVEGLVSVCQDSMDGKSYMITQIEENDIFGEVFLFLKDVGYSQYVIANVNSKVLEIPKEFFTHTCEANCTSHATIISNMLNILARKAFYLNNKVQLLTSGSLRQRLAKYFTGNMTDKGYIKLGMKRDNFAAYLNVTRPSLSRELMKMQEEGIIKVEKDMIKVVDFDKLDDYLT